MSSLPRLLPLGLFFLLAAVLLLGILLPGERSEVPSPLLGREIPEFRLDGLEPGGGLSRADLLREGSETIVALVNIWASWCLPCRAEHPLLMRLSCVSGLAIHGINHKDDREAARAFLGELGNPYERIGVDENGRAALEWGVYGVPETFLVGGGRILYKRAGPLNEQLLERDVLPILQKNGLSTACFSSA